MNKGYKRWIEDNLDIVNKEGVLVPFLLNPIQLKYLTEDTSNLKDFIIKARQQGFSSEILGIFTTDFILKENTYNVVVADDTDNAQGLLKRVKDFLTCWAEKKELELDDLLKYNSKYELYMPHSNCTYIIGTAQNVNFGRSKTITNLHFSEAAFYPHFREMLKGALQAVVPTGRVIIETTANGFNELKTYWDESVLGETPFRPLFYKASDFYSKEFLEEKKRELGRDFMQEYPETALEAFLTSGETYFDKEALKYYLDGVKEPVREIEYV